MDQDAAINAINGRLETAYAGQTPKHWGTVMRYAEGGQDPLDGVSAYAAEEPPHWHYIGFGLSNFGFELSFRLHRNLDSEPPFWPVKFLQQLARYVVNTGESFGYGDYISWGGPISDVEATDLVALIFTTDKLFGVLWLLAR